MQLPDLFDFTVWSWAEDKTQVITSCQESPLKYFQELNHKPKMYNKINSTIGDQN